MDTLADYYNPYYEGEYLTIQIYPREMSLRVVNRSFDYQEAKAFCDFENFSCDCATFSLRIFHQDKLYLTNSDGSLREISKQQDWQVKLDYFKLHHDQDFDGEIVVCNCSYPYFRSYEEVTAGQATTCLIDNDGEVINTCPNCGNQLVYDDIEDEPLYFEEEQEYIPEACQGCKNYHGEVYGEILLVCAMHPYGWENEACPDYMNG